MHHGEYGENIFKEMDKNGDGAISKKEFDAYHSAQFKKFDLNHDGKITQEEMDAVHDKMVDKCDVHADKGYEATSMRASTRPISINDGRFEQGRGGDRDADAVQRISTRSMRTRTARSPRKKWPPT